MDMIHDIMGDLLKARDTLDNLPTTNSDTSAVLNMIITDLYEKLEKVRDANPSQHCKFFINDSSELVVKDIEKWLQADLGIKIIHMNVHAEYGNETIVIYEQNTTK